MCGRFTIISTQEAIEQRFRANFADSIYHPRYNAAPSQTLPVILNTDPGEIRMLKWGINPVWLKKISRKDGLINIRAETLKEKKTFAGDLEKRRCLVIADSFYEWKKEGSKKVPYRILLKTEQPFSFAGLWETNEDSDGKKIETFAIITTTPNKMMEEIHNRMPVILNANDESTWLNPEVPAKAVLSLLRPYRSEKMKSYTVSDYVNRAAFDTPALILPRR